MTTKSNNVNVNLQYILYSSLHLFSKIMYNIYEVISYMFCFIYLLTPKTKIIFFV